MNSINKKQIPKVSVRNDLLKKILKEIEGKQLTTDLINNHIKQQEFFGGK